MTLIAATITAPAVARVIGLGLVHTAVVPAPVVDQRNPAIPRTRIALGIIYFTPSQETASLCREIRG